MTPRHTGAWQARRSCAVAAGSLAHSTATSKFPDEGPDRTPRSREGSRLVEGHAVPLAGRSRPGSDVGFGHCRRDHRWSRCVAAVDDDQQPVAHVRIRPAPARASDPVTHDLARVRGRRRIRCTGEIWLELGRPHGRGRPRRIGEIRLELEGLHGRRLVRIPPAVGAGRLELACPTPQGMWRRPAFRTEWLELAGGSPVAMLGPSYPRTGQAATAADRRPVTAVRRRTTPRRG